MMPSRPCSPVAAEQFGAAADPMRGHQPARARLDQLIEQPSPILVGQADRVVVVDPQHVEDVQGPRPFVALDQFETGSAVVVEHDELGVEDRDVGVHTVGQLDASSG